MRIHVVLTAALVACTPEPDPSTGAPTDPTEEPYVETRPDLSPCSERTEPVVESIDSVNRTYWEHEGIPLCPGDQLAIDLIAPGRLEAVEVVLEEGSVDDIEVVLAYREDVPLLPDDDRWRTEPDFIKACEQWAVPLEIRAAPDAAPARFDVRFIDSGERCPDTDG